MKKLDKYFVCDVKSADGKGFFVKWAEMLSESHFITSERAVT